MKRKWNIHYLLTGVVVLTMISSCSDNESDPEPEFDEPDYVLSLRTQDANDESADYLLAVDDIMTGEISAEGQGIELTGWNYTGKFGDTFFTFGYDLNECIGFDVVEGELVELGKFVFERFDVMNPIDDDYFLAIGAPWGGGSYDCQLQVVDINDISISKTVNHPIYASFDENGEQLNAWPTGSYVDGDKLFISLYPLHGESWETPNTDTAYVSVFSYPELEYIKTIKDPRVSPIGYYGGQPAILEDEVGDHYTISGGSMVTGFTQSTKPSGILRIAAGSDEFDSDYFFNVEELGYKAISGTYLGGGLIVARVISLEMEEQAAPQNVWAAFSEVTPILNVAILDLANQTLTVVDDVPLHGGQYNTPYLIQDGKAYISVNDGTEAYVYEVDPTSASATRGAKLIGNQFQGLYSNAN